MRLASEPVSATLVDEAGRECDFSLGAGEVSDNLTRLRCGNAEGALDVEARLRSES